MRQSCLCSSLKILHGNFALLKAFLTPSWQLNKVCTSQNRSKSSCLIHKSCFLSLHNRNLLPDTSVYKTDCFSPKNMHSLLIQESNLDLSMIYLFTCIWNKIINKNKQFFLNWNSISFQNQITTIDWMSLNTVFSLFASLCEPDINPRSAISEFFWQPYLIIHSSYVFHN